MEADSGDILYVNERACEHLGYSKDELLNLHISAVEMNFGHTLSWDEMVDELMQHTRYTIEGKHKRNDGNIIPVEVDYDLIEQDGERYVLAVVRDIREREQEEQAILDHYSQYHSLFKHSPVPLWKLHIEELLQWIEDPDTIDFDRFVNRYSDVEKGRVLLEKTIIKDANEAALELMNADSIQHFIEEFDSIVTSDFIKALIEALENLLSGIYKYRRETSVNKIGGQNVRIILNAIVPPSSRDDKKHVIFSMNDITPRIQAQERAEERRRDFQESEKKLRQIAEHINEVFWLTDPEKEEVIYANPAYEEVWGVSIEKLYENPKNFLKHIHEEDRENVKEQIPNQITGDYDEVYRVCRPDGEIRWVRDRAFPVENEEGDVYRIAGIAEDITEQKQANKKLEKSLQEKEILLKEIHHRVKNNIQMISSLLRMQARKLEDQELRKILQNCINRIRSMALIHEQLYDTDQLDSIDFTNYFQELCQQIKTFHGLEDSNIQFEVSVDPIELELSTSVSCGLIVNELVSNSIEHGLDGSKNGKISVEFKHFDGRSYKIVVDDNGQGIPDPTKIRNDKGIGLDILETLIEYELNGDLEVNSNSGFRAEINFELDR